MTRSSGDNMGERNQERSEQPDQIQKRRDETFEKDAAKNTTRHGGMDLEPEVEKFYKHTLQILNASGVPYVIGAAFARYYYTGIWRQTKDLDIFIKPEDLKRVLEYFQQQGFETQVMYPHWLAKAFHGERFIDLIFGTGHGQIKIDDCFLEGRRPAEIFGMPTWLESPEALIASAVYVSGRVRFDSSDAVHLIQVFQGKINWQQVLDLLGENRSLLLWVLVLFDIVYPGHSDYLPQDLMGELFKEMQARWEKGKTEPPKAFRGIILDPFSYTVDVEDWGYEDRRRLEPLVDEEGNLL